MPAPPDVGTTGLSDPPQLRAIELPPKIDRDAISRYLQGQLPTEAYLWGCLFEPFIYVVFIGVAIAIVMLYTGSPYRWHALSASIFAISFFVYATYRHYRATASQSRQAVKKYCPDGVAPWCIYCDYDLRGHVESSCPECGKPIFVYDFKWRPWKNRRQRPEK